MIDVVIISTEKVVCATEAQDVVLPVVLGDMGVKERHVQLALGLVIGLVKVKLQDVWVPVLVYSGVAFIFHAQVTVMSENIEEFDFTENPLYEAEVRKELEETVSEFQQVKTRERRRELVLLLRERTARLTAVYLINKQKIPKGLQLYYP